MALSTCKVEYIARTAAVQETVYLSQFLNEVSIGHQDDLPLIFEDNQGTIALAKKQTKNKQTNKQKTVNRQRSKHIDILYHFIRSELNRDKFVLKYCPTGEILADLMTKPATKSQLDKFKVLLFGK